MKLFENLVNFAAKAVLRIVCKVDAWELQKLPATGPAIMIVNHTSNIEGPAIYLLIQPRPTTAMAKIELWSNGFTRFFMDLWQVIPLTRGRVDTRAVNASLKALDDGQILGIAPEGTRRKDGILGNGHPGIAMLATQRRVPIYPIAQIGFTKIGTYLKRLKRAPVRFWVGKPFVVNLPTDSRPTPTQLRGATAEIMYQMARLLPPEFRGPYADLDKLTTEYLEFV